MSIAVSYFKGLRVNATKHAVIDAKAQEMRQQYMCFTAGEENDRRYQSKVASGHHQRNSGAQRHASERTKIGNRVFSKEVIARKEFLMYANKLSPQNKSQIIKTFKLHVRQECLDIYVALSWDLMLRAADYQEMYTEFVAITADNATISEKFKGVYEQYINDRYWYPKKELTIHDSVTEDYDEFCDFVKWKKRAAAAVKAITVMVKCGWIPSSCIPNVISLIIEDVKNEIESQSSHNAQIGTRTLDALLEQLFILGNLSEKNEYLIANVATIVEDIDKFRPATKFKILDLKEALSVNQGK